LKQTQETMNLNPICKLHLGTLALAIALGAGYASAQTLHVGGDGTIGDTVLTTIGGTALVGVTGGSWTTAGGTGTPVSSTLVSPAAVVPTTGNVTLSFTHRYNFEEGWDGGAVLISVNGNPAVYLPGTAFSSNGYVGNTTSGPSNAWAGGENVFYGQSAGYGTPALITSVANLGALTAGDTVSVHFKGEWDEFTTNASPNWEIGAIKLTDGMATDFVDVTFSSGSSSGFTVSSAGPPAGPWVFTLQTAASSFEINGDTLAADRYVPDIPGSILDLSNAAIVVKLLAGTLEGGEVFSLFDLSGGTTLTGTPTSITVPPLGVWDTSNLAINGTITFVSPPPTLTWNLTDPGNGVWDEATANWTADGGVTTTTFSPAAHVIFNKAEGGVITVLGMSPSSMTVNSDGDYSFGPALTPGEPSILSGSLTKTGNGILRLGDVVWTNTANAGSYSNGFSSVNVNGGILYYGSRNALGTGTVTLAGGTAIRKFGEEGNAAGLTMTNNFVLNGEVNMHIQFSSFKDQWFSGVISGPGGIKVTGERRALTLTGNNTFEGGVVMENHTGTANVSNYNLDIGHVNALGTGTLTVKTAFNSLLTQFRGLGTTTALTADSGVMNNIVIDTGATFYLGRGANLRLGGNISGAGGLFKRNTTTVFLDGNNTYTGGTRVEAGVLTVDGTLADATMNITGGTVDGTGTLTFNIDGAVADQIVMSAGTLTATGLKLAINASGAGLTESEYVLVNLSGGTLTETFASISGAPGYVLNYDTPGQVKLVATGGGTPYSSWAGSEAFGSDKNGDGVANGLAFLLGAVDPDQSALGLLPVVSQNASGLVLTFSVRNAATRGPAAAKVQWSSDLGQTDLWPANEAAVPESSSLVNGVNFVITPNGNLNQVVATIPSGEGPDGKLFGRLEGTEN
jgi:fibronectin-binding autotransporter adhesin